jgi:succinyl-diaminopimelate desuccinylase
VTSIPRSVAVIELARSLIEIDTANPPGSELAAAERVAERLRAGGVEVTVHPFGDRRANLLARIPGTGDRPALVLSGHLDTVPVGPQEWQHPPRAGEVDGGRLYGRGAVDMKGSVAAMALAMCELRQSAGEPAGDVLLALTGGEETDSCGAWMLARSGLLAHAGMLVVGEPTGFGVGIAHRGALWVRVTATGKRGHGSQPVRENNAICRLLDWLHPLDEIEAMVADGDDPLLGSGSVSVNVIAGGDAANVVPDLAEATLDFRTVPGQDHAELLERLRSRGPDLSVTVVRDAPPVSTAADSEIVEVALEAVAAATGASAHTRGLAYLTDASAFVAVLGLPAVIVGPGREQQAHVVDENVPVEALEQAVELYRRIALATVYGGPSAA